MNNADLAARLVQALEEAAAHEAGGEATLVSVEVHVLAAGNGARVTTRLERKTRTLVFLSAEIVSEGGARIAVASSVHKLAL